ncbi:MAG: DUF1080 domain-containing protein [Bacteroidota bacterium]|nr:DUF1080 domain-containing protein [Bacteroidota bacterium]
MKSILLSVIFLFATLVAVSQKKAPKPTWESLFNGKTLKGWTELNGKSTYEAKNGTIVGTTVLNTPNSFLCTNKLYTNFILEYDVKVDEQLNSGVQIRSESLKEYQNGRVHGYQVEIDPSSRAWSAGIYDEGRRGWLNPLDKNKTAGAAFKHNDWNHYRVEAIGDTIRTWINGVAAANLIDDMTHTGFIGLQVHHATKAGLQVSWKNLRIITKNPEKFKTPTTAPLYNTIPNNLSEDEINNGWKLLWDGKTTQGWRGVGKKPFPAKGWVIENHELKEVHGDPKAGPSGGDIVTIDEYSNFELSVDWKITRGANSGIKYFITEAYKDPSVGCEFQILDDAVHPDAKLGINGDRTCGSLYDLIPAVANKKVNPVGEWNQARIIVKGNHVEHWLNGMKVVEYERTGQMFQTIFNTSKFKNFAGFGAAPQGHILLQDHGNDVAFRNVKIRVL